MKYIIQLFKCLALLFVVVVSTMGATGQTNQSLTQQVCIGNELYSIDISLLSDPTYHWSISGGVATTDWQINGTAAEITIDWRSEGVYVLSVFTRSNGCDGPTQAITVTVTALPTAFIAYTGSPWCTDADLHAVTLTGTGAYTGGIYSSTDGLIINQATGEINPLTSTAGIYLVTYTTLAVAGCETVTATTTVTISPIPITSLIWHN